MKQIINNIKKRGLTHCFVNNDVRPSELHVVNNLMFIDSRLEGSHVWVSEREEIFVHTMHNNMSGEHVFRRIENEELFSFLNSLLNQK